MRSVRFTVKPLRVVIAVFLLASTLTVAGALSASKITGIYSNLRFNDEGGDLLGMEILVLPRESKGGTSATYNVVVQIADGGAPYVVVVPLEWMGDHFDCPLSAGDYGGQHLTLRFQGSELLVLWPGGNQEKLKRGKSYWQ